MVHEDAGQERDIEALWCGCCSGQEEASAQHSGEEAASAIVGRTLTPLLLSVLPPVPNCSLVMLMGPLDGLG
jgi:hypothetical protein